MCGCQNPIADIISGIPLRATLRQVSTSLLFRFLNILNINFNFVLLITTREEFALRKNEVRPG